MYVFRRKVFFVKIDWLGFWSKFLVNGLVKLESFGFVYFTSAFIVVKVSRRQSTDILSVGQEDLCSEHGSNINGRSKVSSKDHFIIRLFGRVMVHYPIKPTELAYSADIGGLSGYNSLWDLSGGNVSIIGRARVDQRLRCNLSGSPLVLGAAFNQYNGLHPRGVRLHLS
jgi:hypothetical protein